MSDETKSTQRPSHDPRFVSLGSAYLHRLGGVYAKAWTDGAEALDTGEGISRAVETVARSWSAGRSNLYDQLITPEFGKLLPEGVSDEAVTSAQRVALAAAWRGFAKGLSQ
jgi:hypothetical protein